MQNGKWVKGEPRSSQWTIAGFRDGQLYYRSRNGVLWVQRGEQWYRWAPAKKTPNTGR